MVESDCEIMTLVDGILVFFFSYNRDAVILSPHGFSQTNNSLMIRWQKERCDHASKNVKPCSFLKM